MTSVCNQSITLAMSTTESLGREEKCRGLSADFHEHTLLEGPHALSDASGRRRNYQSTLARDAINSQESWLEFRTKDSSIACYTQNWMNRAKFRDVSCEENVDIKCGRNRHTFVWLNGVNTPEKKQQASSFVPRSHNRQHLHISCHQIIKRALMGMFAHKFSSYSHQSLGQ